MSRAMERARGVVTRKMVDDDVHGRNTAEERSYLRDLAQVAKFYDELKAYAAEVHREIECTPAYERAVRRQLNRRYSRISERLVEVKPAAKEANRRAHSAVANGESHVLYSAIKKHRDAHVDRNIEPTEHDMELWAILERSSAEIAEKA